MNNFNKNKRIMRVIAAIVVFFFSVNTVFLPTPLLAQTVFNLPVPGVIVNLSPAFTPVMMKGLTLYPDNPFKFDFIIDQGDSKLEGEKFKEESTKLIKYFMSALTVPEENMWVNLSPNEPNRIIADGLNKTEMGRDLLAQDYILKQLTASLMIPENELGKEFWDRVRKEAKEKFNTDDIPMDTFHKVWIVPEKAVVYTHDKSAFVVESHLKVMLEDDYLATKNNSDHLEDGRLKREDGTRSEYPSSIINPPSSSSPEITNILRRLIIPAIEKEVNEGKNFAQLRQVYNSLILATWYKKNLKQSVLGKVYVDQNKTKGVETDDKSAKEKIYNQYLEAFKKGVYDVIKDDYDPETQEIIPRKYFSGGVDAAMMTTIQSTTIGLNLYQRGQLPQGDEAVFTTVLKTMSVGNESVQPAQSDAAMMTNYDAEKLAKDPRTPIQILLEEPAYKRIYGNLENLQKRTGINNIDQFLADFYFNPFRLSFDERLNQMRNDKEKFKDSPAAERQKGEQQISERIDLVISVDDFIKKEENHINPIFSDRPGIMMAWKLGQLALKDVEPNGESEVREKTFSKDFPLAKEEGVLKNLRPSGPAVLVLAAGLRPAFYFQSLPPGKYIFVDNSAFMQAFLESAKTRFARSIHPGVEIIIRRANLQSDHEAFVGEERYQHIEINDMDRYVPALKTDKMFYQRLLDRVAPGGTISIEYDQSKESSNQGRFSLAQVRQNISNRQDWSQPETTNTTRGLSNEPLEYFLFQKDEAMMTEPATRLKEYTTLLEEWQDSNGFSDTKLKNLIKRTDDVVWFVNNSYSEDLKGIDLFELYLKRIQGIIRYLKMVLETTEGFTTEDQDLFFSWIRKAKSDISRLTYVYRKEELAGAFKTELDNIADSINLGSVDLKYELTLFQRLKNYWRDSVSRKTKTRVARIATAGLLTAVVTNVPGDYSPYHGLSSREIFAAMHISGLERSYYETLAFNLGAESGYEALFSILDINNNYSSEERASVLQILAYHRGDLEKTSDKIKDQLQEVLGRLYLELSNKEPESTSDFQPGNNGLWTLFSIAKNLDLKFSSEEVMQAIKNKAFAYRVNVNHPLEFYYFAYIAPQAFINNFVSSVERTAHIDEYSMYCLSLMSEIRGEFGYKFSEEQMDIVEENTRKLLSKYDSKQDSPEEILGALRAFRAFTDYNDNLFYRIKRVYQSVFNEKQRLAFFAALTSDSRNYRGTTAYTLYEIDSDLILNYFLNPNNISELSQDEINLRIDIAKTLLDDNKDDEKVRKVVISFLAALINQTGDNLDYLKKLDGFMEGYQPLFSEIDQKAIVQTLTPKTRERLIEIVFKTRAIDNETYTIIDRLLSPTITEDTINNFLDQKQKGQLTIEETAVLIQIATENGMFEIPVNEDTDENLEEDEKGEYGPSFDYEKLGKLYGRIINIMGMSKLEHVKFILESVDRHDISPQSLSPHIGNDILQRLERILLTVKKVDFTYIENEEEQDSDEFELQKFKDNLRLFLIKINPGYFINKYFTLLKRTDLNTIDIQFLLELNNTIALELDINNALTPLQRKQILGFWTSIINSGVIKNSDQFINALTVINRFHFDGLDEPEWDYNNLSDETKNRVEELAINKKETLNQAQQNDTVNFLIRYDPEIVLKHFQVAETRRTTLTHRQFFVIAISNFASRRDLPKEQYDRIQQFIGEVLDQGTTDDFQFIIEIMNALSSSNLSWVDQIKDKLGALLLRGMDALPEFGADSFFEYVRVYTLFKRFEALYPNQLQSIKDQLVNFMNTEVDVERLQAKGLAVDSLEKFALAINFVSEIYGDGPLLAKLVEQMYQFINPKSIGLTSQSDLEKARQYLNSIDPVMGDRILMHLTIRYVQQELDYEHLDLKDLKQTVKLGEQFHNPRDVYNQDVEQLYKLIGNFILGRVTDVINKDPETVLTALGEEELTALINILNRYEFYIVTPDSTSSKFWNQLRQGNVGYIAHKAGTYIFEGEKVELERARYDISDVPEYQLEDGARFLEIKDKQTGNRLAYILKLDTKKGGRAILATDVGRLHGGVTPEQLQKKIGKKGRGIQSNPVSMTTGDAKPTEFMIEDGIVKNYLMTANGKDGFVIIYQDGRMHIANKQDLWIHDLNPNVAKGSKEDRKLNVTTNIADFLFFIDIARGEQREQKRKQKLSLVCNMLLYDAPHFYPLKDGPDHRRLIIEFEDGSIGVLSTGVDVSMGTDEAVKLAVIAGAKRVVYADTGQYDNAPFFSLNKELLQLGIIDQAASSNGLMFYIEYVHEDNIDQILKGLGHDPTKITEEQKTSLIKEYPEKVREYPKKSREDIVRDILKGMNIVSQNDTSAQDNTTVKEKSAPQQVALLDPKTGVGFYYLPESVRLDGSIRVRQLGVIDLSLVGFKPKNTDEAMMTNIPTEQTTEARGFMGIRPWARAKAQRVAATIGTWPGLKIIARVIESPDEKRYRKASDYLSKYVNFIEQAARSGILITLKPENARTGFPYFMKTYQTFPIDSKLLNDADLFDTFLHLWQELDKTAQEITNDVSVRSLKKFAQMKKMLEENWKGTRPTQETNETKRIRRFFQGTWQDFIIAASFENVTKQEALKGKLIAEAQAINYQMGEMISELVKVSRNLEDFKRNKQFLTQWQRFNETFLVPRKIYADVNILNSYDEESGHIGKARIEAFIYRIERTEIKQVNKRSTKAIYCRKIDFSGIKTNVAGHSIKGEKIIFINADELDHQIKKIRNILNGAQHYLGDDADRPIESITQFIRQTFYGMSDEKIRKELERSIIIHELTHKAQELSGLRYKLNDNFGFSSDAWGKMPETTRELIDYEVAAHLAEIAFDKNPALTLVRLLYCLEFKVDYQYHVAAAYLFSTLAGNKKAIDFDSLTEVRNIFDQLMNDPQLQQKARDLFNTAFNGLEQVDAAMFSTADQIKAPGGIDLNPSKMNLKEQGDAVPINIPTDPAMLTNFQIDGAYPVIINIQPIKNLPMLIGITTAEKEESLSLAK